jgi:hypothetical protein
MMPTERVLGRGRPLPVTAACEDEEASMHSDKDKGCNGAAGGARFLSLAAAPTFAIMALLTGLLDSGSSATICSAAPPAWPLTGMVVMYLLMGAFHAAPWLLLVSRRRTAAAVPGPARALTPEKAIS